MMNYRKFTVN